METIDLARLIAFLFIFVVTTSNIVMAVVTSQLEGNSEKSQMLFMTIVFNSILFIITLAVIKANF